MRRAKWVAGAVVAVVVAAAGIMALDGDDGYELRILMPSAGKTFVGARAVIDGSPVGEVTDLGVVDDKALVTVSLEDGAAPLHEGTTARITWESVIGAQVVELLPGPGRNAALPSGKQVVSDIESVQVDDVLAALDKPTRARLQGLVKELDKTLSGREKQLRETLATAGPAVQGVGEVLRAVGEDGPAIRQLIRQLREMAGELASRDEHLARSVRNVDELTAEVAGQQSRLKEALDELPSTVQEGTRTLDKVPGTVDSLGPLLADLRPATRQLPETARNLSPVLSELRRTVSVLKPTLRAADGLLQRTPQLLDSAHGTLPGVTATINEVQPAVAYLRPYTPELAGWLSNWVSAFGSQASNGRNIARALITGSSTSLTDNPGVIPPGVKQDPRPAPGSIAGQPWVDANGDGVR
ncbi:MlaD family protein [Haloechinothrix salitolerans]|uniref:MlaD family protein n=1 Tax=Haloechinothrix salitolerans TaxID=926830 RepID=A0ABW2C4Y2_9PSEU